MCIYKILLYRLYKVAKLQKFTGYRLLSWAAPQKRFKGSLIIQTDIWPQQ